MRGYSMDTNAQDSGIHGPELVHMAEKLLAAYNALAAERGIANTTEARLANELRTKIAETRELYGMQKGGV
jgi:hypothetical protein